MAEQAPRIPGTPLSTMPYHRWQQSARRTFGDDAATAGAIPDRLLHYRAVFARSGPSYRLRGELAH